MKMKRIIISLVATALVGGVAIGAYIYHQFKLDGTTLSFELTAEGQPVAPGEVPKLFCNGAPLNSGDKVAYGKVEITSQSDFFRNVKQETQVELGKANTVRIDLKYKVGSIEVETDPSGADVFQAGKSLGSTPLKLPNERVGPHQYSLSLKGWKDAILRGRVEDGKNLKLTYKFPYGNISITSEPAGAAIKQGGYNLGNTPLELKGVPAGDVSMELSMEGWSPVQVTGRLDDGKDLHLSHHFPNGGVTITSEPTGATVMRGGRALGTTPLEIKSIPHGTIVSYSLEMKEHRSQNVEGRIQDNENLKLSAKIISFQEEERQRAEAERIRAEKDRQEAEARQRQIAENERAAKIQFLTTSIYGRWTGTTKWDTSFFKTEECPCILLIEPRREILMYSVVTPKEQLNFRFKIRSISKGRVYAESLENTDSSIENITFSMGSRDLNSGTLSIYTETREDGVVTLAANHGQPIITRKTNVIIFNRDLSYIK